MRVSGFSIVRNAELLDFPVEASIRSILPICYEVVVNVGRSEDRTLELVRAIGDPKLRILETEWELERGEVPLEVAIDEAVSLAKRYSSEDAGRLVNGILGRAAREAHT